MGTSVVSGQAAATNTSKYDRVVNIVEVGADNTGSTPIDGVLDQYEKDGTLIEFPNGRYLIDQQSLYGRSNFGMRAIGDDVTLVPASQKDYWIAGAQMDDFLFEGFTIDCRESGIHPKLAFSVHDNLVIRDVEKIGVHDGYNEAFGLTVLDSNGSGLVENLRMADGGVHNGYSSSGYTKGPTAIYADTNGSLTFRDCHVEGFADNGLYASMSDGPVKVEGGTYKNNDVAQVRLGSDGSYVRGASIFVDDGLSNNAKNARGVRISDGPSSASGRVLVDDCDISLTGGVGAGGVVGAFDGGAFTVRNTRIRVDEGYTTYSGGRCGYGVLADSPSGSVGSVVVDGCSITGTAASNAAIQCRDRHDTTVKNSCIQQTNGSRDGVEFDGGSSNSVVDSTIDVAGLMVDGGITSGLTDSGTCPVPFSGSSDGSSGGSTSESSGSATGEVGSVSFKQAGRGDWQSLSYTQSYTDPVVVMKGATENGRQSGHVRLANVGGNSASYMFEEWKYLDGAHTTEDVGYMTVEQGTQTLPNGTRVESGTVTAQEAFTNVSLSTNFDAPPVVLAQAQSYNGSHPIITRVYDVTSSGFSARVQEEEAQGPHKPETIGYVAIEQGTDTLNGVPIEAGTTSLDDDWAWVGFKQGYNRPRVVAGVQSYNGWNPVTVRTSNFLRWGMNARLKEEQSHDSETWHTSEQVGYVVIETQP